MLFKKQGFGFQIATAKNILACLMAEEKLPYLAIRASTPIHSRELFATRDLPTRNLKNCCRIKQKLYSSKNSCAIITLQMNLARDMIMNYTYVLQSEDENAF